MTPANDQDRPALREQHEWLRVTLASIGDGVIATDAEGRVTFLNPVAESLTGWTTDGAEGQPLTTVFRIVNEESRLPVDDPVTKALASGAVIGLANHTVLIAKDGTEHAIDDSAAPIRTADGSIIGCVLIFRDIGARREAERSIAEARHYAESVVDTVRSPLLVLDGTLRIRSASRSFYRIFNVTPSETEGRFLYDLGNGQWNIPALRHLLEDILPQNVTLEGYEVEHEFPDIGRRTMVLDARRIERDGGQSDRILLGIEDVTERTNAQARLLESEAFNRSLMDGSTDCLKVLDLQGRVLHMNAAGQCLMEVDDFSLLRGRDWGSLWPAAARADIDRAVECARRGEAYSFEAFCPTAKGTPKWWNVDVTPVLGSDRNVVRILSVSRDVTERRRLDDELRQYAAELSLADLRKNEFLAMLAHELRNPLAPIRNAVHMLQARATDAETVLSASRMLDRQVSQMIRLVDDLLDVSRISRGKSELRTGRVELASVVYQAVEAADSLFDARGQTLVTAIDPETIVLDADPTRLAQVVGNLLNNASKFSHRGGTVRLTVRREGGTAVVLIEDDGVGIAAEQLPRIFDMFMQIDTSLERSASGLGIGLTLVRSLVEMHAGTVEAHSGGLGHGSEFIVRLPIASEVLPTAGASTVRPAASETSRRILVVDDNADAAESLSMLLALRGHECRTAADGLEAIALAESFRPEVVLLDIGLPKLNGYEAARRIRAQPWGAPITLVALTGWGQADDRQRASDAGFDAHMTKPVDHAALATFLAGLSTTPR